MRVWQDGEWQKEEAEAEEIGRAPTLIPPEPALQMHREGAKTSSKTARRGSRRRLSGDAHGAQEALIARRQLAERIYLAYHDGSAPVSWDKMDPVQRGTFIRAADALVVEMMGRAAANVGET